MICGTFAGARTFWFKIDKVVAYKQRLEWQGEQRKAMDRHLVHLVRQTERYTGDLASKLATGECDDDAGDSRARGADGTGTNRHKRKLRSGGTDESSEDPLADADAGAALAERLEAADAAS